MIAGIALTATMYIVKPGDTLWGIVGTRWPVVCEVNHLADCNLIYPGQRLNIGTENDLDTNAVIVEGSPLSTDSASQGPYFSCSGLESLWVNNGGKRSEAFIAAEIAMAESGGYEYATGAAGEEGLWQINPVNGDATYNPDGNAQAAIYISGNGTDWYPWTTYVHGLYEGRC